VGYIGGYTSFIGYDKRHGNAIVVLQNGFNWSNYLGIALLVDLATQDKVVRSVTWPVCSKVNSAFFPAHSSSTTELKCDKL